MCVSVSASTLFWGVSISARVTVGDQFKVSVRLCEQRGECERGSEEVVIVSRMVNWCEQGSEHEWVVNECERDK